MISIILVFIIAYIMGSFPMGVWIGKAFFGKDITVEGSKNPGATNAYRVLGPAGGLLVFGGDFLKGAIPVMLMKLVITDLALSSWLAVAAGLLAIIGHSFSVFLKFKGGKGAATATGVIMAIAPFVAISIAVVWFVVLGISRYVSIASIVAAISFPVWVLVFVPQNMALLALSFLVIVLIIYKHRSNISRLLNGTEPRVGVKTNPKS